LAEWVRLGPYIVTVTVLAPLLLSDLADIRIAFQWTVYVGGAVCLLALVFGKWGFRGLLLNGDLYETETNPLALASLGGVVLLAAATLMLQKKHLVLKIINIACIPLALAVILKSGSRGQLLATGPAFVVAWLIAFRLKNVGSVAALLLTACFVVGIGVWAATIVEVDSSRWASNQTHEDVAGRLAMAQTLLGAAFASPGTILFGIGNSSSFQILGIYPHITILEVIAEEGLIGTTLYLAVLAIALRSIIRIARSLADDETARSTLAILASLFCFELILTWKQGSLLSSYYVFAYTIILGRMETPAAVKVSIERVTSPVAGLRLFPNLMR
jgi:O-antigen ligase